MARRRRYQRVLLPGEREGRREFLKKGLVGAVLLAAGGGTWLATRRTRPAPGVGPLQVLTPQEGTVVLAIANRLVPERVGFPRPLEVGVPRKVDAVVASMHPETQKDLKRLINLFEGALAGFVFEGQLRTFTGSSPWEQDERLRGWATSRVTLRRSGYRALKKLVYATYYSSPETYGAVAYPGPPLAPPPVPAERPAVVQGGEEEKQAPSAQRAETRISPPRARARSSGEALPAEATPASGPARAAAARPRQAAGPGPGAPQRMDESAPGPPTAASAPAPGPAEPASPRPVEPVPAPRPVEAIPAPRSGVPMPEEKVP